MHELTKAGDYGLEITLEENDGSVKILNWEESFKVNGENDKFRLSISGIRAGSSGLSDGFQYHNWKQFTTRDNDNDENSNNYATKYGKT